MKLFLFGLFLTLTSWIFAWGKFGFLSENSFFPLWLGYILTINGLSNYLFKKSLLSKMKKKFIVLFLIFEPINYFLKFPSILQNIKKGQWSLPISIALAALFTGFWWEMWNFYSYPKWTYELYFVDFFKIFEMPILGYTGYPMFGLEIYAFTNLCMGILESFIPLILNFLELFWPWIVPILALALTS